jgi:hypothetical protein
MKNVNTDDEIDEFLHVFAEDVAVGIEDAEARSRQRRPSKKLVIAVILLVAAFWIFTGAWSFFVLPT